MNPHHHTLEFHKILDMLKGLGVQRHHRDMIAAITPTADLADARAEMDKTSDALRLSIQFGAPPFHTFSDMRMGLRRAKSGVAAVAEKICWRSPQSCAKCRLSATGTIAVPGWNRRWTIGSPSLHPVPFLLEKIDRSILSEEESLTPQVRRWRRSAARSAVPGKASGYARQHDASAGCAGVPARQPRNASGWTICASCASRTPGKDPGTGTRHLCHRTDHFYRTHRSGGMLTMTSACWNFKRRKRLNGSSKSFALTAAHGQMP